MWSGLHSQNGRLFLTTHFSELPQLITLQGSTQLFLPLMLMLQMVPGWQSEEEEQVTWREHPDLRSRGLPVKPS